MGVQFVIATKWTSIPKSKQFLIAHRLKLIEKSKLTPINWLYISQSINTATKFLISSKNLVGKIFPLRKLKFDEQLSITRTNERRLIHSLWFTTLLDWRPTSIQSHFLITLIVKLVKIRVKVYRYWFRSPTKTYSFYL